MLLLTRETSLQTAVCRGNDIGRNLVYIEFLGYDVPTETKGGRGRDGVIPEVQYYMTRWPVQVNKMNFDGRASISSYG